MAATVGVPQFPITSLTSPYVQASARRAVGPGVICRAWRRALEVAQTVANYSSNAMGAGLGFIPPAICGHTLKPHRGYFFLSSSVQLRTTVIGVLVSAPFELASGSERASSFLRRLYAKRRVTRLIKIPQALFEVGLRIHRQVLRPFGISFSASPCEETQRPSGHFWTYIALTADLPTLDFECHFSNTSVAFKARCGPMSKIMK